MCNLRFHNDVYNRGFTELVSHREWCKDMAHIPSAQIGVSLAGHGVHLRKLKGSREPRLNIDNCQPICLKSRPGRNYRKKKKKKDRRIQRTFQFCMLVRLIGQAESVHRERSHE